MLYDLNAHLSEGRLSKSKSARRGFFAPPEPHRRPIPLAQGESVSSGFPCMRARNRNKGKTIMIWNRKTSRMGTLAGLLLAANGLFASTVTYDFIGTPFTSGISAPYTTSDRVTATITFADALPASMALQAVTPLSLIMTDGHQVFDYS